MQSTRKQSPVRSNAKTQVMLIDDHPIVHMGLRQLIDSQADLEVCSVAENPFEAIRMVDQKRPDIVILDISLGKSSGLDLIRDIKNQSTAIMCLVLSMHDETLYAERVLRAGAQGYIMKTEKPEILLDAVRKVLSGQIYVSDRMAGRMVSKLVGSGSDTSESPVSNLSDRELQVFRLIGQGHGTRHIAKGLHLSIKTIETYRAHIKDKLGLADADELLQYAIKWENS